MCYEQYQLDKEKIATLLKIKPYTILELSVETSFPCSYICSILWNMKKESNKVLREGNCESATYHIPGSGGLSIIVPRYVPDLNNPKVKYKIIQVVKMLRVGGKSSDRICRMLCITSSMLEGLEKDNSYLAG